MKVKNLKSQNTEIKMYIFMYIYIISYDIHCAYSDQQEGKISQSEFDQTDGKRIVTGTYYVAGSTAGAAIGQVVIPVPIVGGFVGGIKGSFFWEVCPRTGCILTIRTQTLRIKPIKF